MNRKELRDITRKMKVLNHAKESGNITFTCRHFGISRTTFYKWSKNYQEKGEKGLINSKPCPENPKLRLSKHIEEKILYLRKEHHFSAQRISWCMERHFDLKVSKNGVRNVLIRNGIGKLPAYYRKRSNRPPVRYEKKVPGHHIQIDVKFLRFTDTTGRKIRRFQYTAIDDATRVRALKVYDKHTQSNAIDFVNYVVQKFPFRIHTIRTDNGHEFQIKFNYHCSDLGITHVYIRPRTPRLNGKVERSHKTDQQEFYQFFSYKDDVDLNEKVFSWESFYNHCRPHYSLKGKTPSEVLLEKMKGQMYNEQQNSLNFCSI